MIGGDTLLEIPRNHLEEYIIDDYAKDGGQGGSSLRVAPSVKDERVYATAGQSLLQERK